MDAARYEFFLFDESKDDPGNEREYGHRAPPVALSWAPRTTKAGALSTRWVFIHCCGQIGYVEPGTSAVRSYRPCSARAQPPLSHHPGDLELLRCTRAQVTRHGGKLPIARWTCCGSEALQATWSDSWDTRNKAIPPEIIQPGCCSGPPKPFAATAASRHPSSLSSPKPAIGGGGDRMFAMVVTRAKYVDGTAVKAPDDDAPAAVPLIGGGNDNTCSITGAGGQTCPSSVERTSCGAEESAAAAAAATAGNGDDNGGRIDGPPCAGPADGGPEKEEEENLEERDPAAWLMTSPAAPPAAMGNGNVVSSSLSVPPRVATRPMTSTAIRQGQLMLQGPSSKAPHLRGRPNQDDEGGPEPPPAKRMALMTRLPFGDQTADGGAMQQPLKIYTSGNVSTDGAVKATARDRPSTETPLLAVASAPRGSADALKGHEQQPPQQQRLLRPHQDSAAAASSSGICLPAALGPVTLDPATVTPTEPFARQVLFSGSSGMLLQVSAALRDGTVDPGALPRVRVAFRPQDSRLYTADIRRLFALRVAGLRSVPATLVPWGPEHSQSLSRAQSATAAIRLVEQKRQRRRQQEDEELELEQQGELRPAAHLPQQGTSRSCCRTDAATATTITRDQLMPGATDDGSSVELSDEDAIRQAQVAIALLEHEKEERRRTSAAVAAMAAAAGGGSRGSGAPYAGILSDPTMSSAPPLPELPDEPCTIC